MIFTAIALFFSITGFAQMLNSKRLNANQKETIQPLSQANSNLEASHAEPSAADNISPFDAVKGKREDVSKRDAFSKHYINEDGSFTAIIGAGPIHYEKNGQFLDIDHKIAPNSNMTFPYVNATNLFESYFGATSHTGIKNKTQEGEITEFLNTKMYWEVNGQAVNTLNSVNVPVSIQEDKAYYHNIYGNISAEFTILTGKRKLNYIIPNQQALGNIPTGADYLVFTEDVILPFGWTSTITDSGVMIKDQLGKEIYLYENPVSTDAIQNELEAQVNTIFETYQLGNTLTVKTKVKAEWLLNNERVFPVMVDPTTDYYPNETTHRTGQCFTTGGGYGNMAVGYVGGYYRGFATFDITSITDGSTISTTVLYHYVGTTTGMGTARGSELRAYLGLPQDQGTFPNLYNAITNPTISPSIYQTVYNLGTIGWKNPTLGSTANGHLQNRLNVNNFTIGYRPAGTYSGANQYALLYGMPDPGGLGRHPYIKVTYTEPTTPPSCATNISPANGATGVAHQGSLVWSSVPGATSYDVYFGNTATPPLVSTSQTGTSYAITDCLLPNTTYYWRVVPKNANGSATGCATWSFTTDNKLHIYQNDFETASLGYFGTSGTSVDGWYTNNNSGTGGTATLGYNNTWTVGEGTFAISGKSVGVSALYNGSLAGSYFQYYIDLGEFHRWIYRPFDMRGYRDIEISFKWKSGGEANQDYGSVISSINGGNNWLMDNQGGLYNDGRYWSSPNTIQNQTLILPNTRNNQQNFVLGFKWDDWSGNNIGTDPSFVVDDIVVRACPFEGDILSDEVNPGVYEWIPAGSTETTLTIDGSHPCAQFEWEQSIDGGVNWTVIPGATSVSYTTPNNLEEDTWYRSRVYFSTGCPGVYQEQPFKIIIPDCTTSTTWDGSSWSNDVPTSSDTKIIFEGNYTSSNANTDNGALIGCSVEVRNTAQVVISSGHSITIDNEILVVNTANFTLENDANLVQIDSDAENEGIIAVKRNSTPVVRQDATGWSSPVSGQNVRSFSAGTLKKRYYIYNGYGAAGTGGSSFKGLFEFDPLYPMPNPIPAEWPGERVMVSGQELFDENTYTFQEGIGYSIRVPNSWNSTTASAFSGTFTGEPHNGDIEVPAYGKYTMVGNPYPSAIDAEDFFDANTAVETLHFWTHYFPVGHASYNSNYVTYTRAGGAGTHPGGGTPPNETIPVAQGFVVENGTIEVEESNTSWPVYFNNDMRTASADGIFYKNEDWERHRFWLSLTNDNEEKTAQILIAYMTGATDGYDHQIDGKRMGTAQLYSLLDEEKYTVQGRALPFSDEDVVPLGFTASEAGNFTIGIDDLDGFFAEDTVEIYLRDKLKESELNLSESDYLFESGPGEFLNRFEIIYKTEEILDVTDLDQTLVQIYHSGENIVIRSEKEKILSVNLYDLSGRNVHKNEKVNANVYRIHKTSLSTQVLVVKVLTEKGELVTKKIINN